MEKSKLLAVFKTMDADELKAFSDFVASPFFNKKTELLLLTNYITEQAPLFKPAGLVRQKVYKAIFPDKNFNEKQFGYLTSYLTKLLFRFFKIQKFETDKTYQDYYLLSTLLDKKLFKLYEQESRKIKVEIEQQNIKGSAYYLQHYLLSKTADEYGRKRNSREPDNHLQESTNYLDAYYIYTKLVNSCNLKDRQKFLITDYKLHLLEEIEHFVKHNVIKNEPGIAIYSAILQMLSDENSEVHFKTLKKLIDKHFQEISKRDIHNAYLYAINFCARKIRAGENAYFEEALNLYVNGIERQILYENGMLSPWTFANVVKVALRLKRYQWIEQFIETNHSKLPPEIQQNVLNFNLAELFYSTHEFDKAIIHLNRVKYTDSTYSLGSRVILAKIYYETGEEEALLSLIASFSIFLKRNKKISAGVKKPYLNFCDLLYGLMRKKIKKLAGLKEQILNTESLTERAWLKQICAELMIELQES